VKRALPEDGGDGVIQGRRWALRTAGVGVLAISSSVVGRGWAQTPPLPPPPPNPSDADLAAGRAALATTDGELAALAADVDNASAAVTAAQAQLGAALDDADAAAAARVSARAEADAAQARAVATQQGQRVAAGLVTDAQQRLDDLVSASYRQGSVPGSLAGYLGATDAQNVLDRAELLNAVAGNQQETRSALGRALVAKANQDSEARSALERAQIRRSEADAADARARSAYDTAVQVTSQATSRTADLLSARAAAESRLAVAQQSLLGLDGQRRTYEQWVSARRAAEAAAAAELAAADQARRRAQAEAAAAAVVQSRPGAPGEGAPAQVSSPPAVVRPPSTSGTVAPANGRITSRFGPRDGTVHFGVDIANSTGTPIVSVQAGTVISSGPASGFGLWVRVRHDDGTISVYGHNDRNVVTVGQRVGAGQQIATIGNRGESSGSHVHVEIAVGGTLKVDPLSWLRERGVDI
jgi:murein DD-endopeptidase MepM/ murein hydrolase activator NlpD